MSAPQFAHPSVPSRSATGLEQAHECSPATDEVGAGSPRSAGEADAIWQRSQPVVLRLDELLAGPDGEIVLSVGEGVRTVVLETTAGVREEGTADLGNPAGAGSSTEMGFLAFETGTTLFFPADIEVLIRSPEIG